ncbi:diguanylate cyclase [Burkholderia metallica]|nr:diguanylate cyclase [Burkholderia metallica]
MGHTSRSLVPVNAFAHSLFALPPPGWPSGRSVEIESISKTDARSRVRQHGRREAHAAVAFAATEDTRIVSGVRKADILSESGKSHS